jgi:hypothetical protein
MHAWRTEAGASLVDEASAGSRGTRKPGLRSLTPKARRLEYLAPLLDLDVALRRVPACANVTRA